LLSLLAEEYDLTSVAVAVAVAEVEDVVKRKSVPKIVEGEV
jgi:hypothetical protein